MAQTREIYVTGNPTLDMLLNRIGERLDRIEGIKPNLETGLLKLEEDKEITTTNDVELDSAILNGLTANRLVETSATKELASVTDLTEYVAGTSNRVTVASDGDGTITLSTPQDTHTGASPTFAGATLSGLTASRILYGNGSKVISSISDLTAWIAGTAYKITSSSDGDGTITLTIPDPSRLGAASHYVEFENGTGFIKRIGNAKYYEDLQVSISNVRVPAANAPTERLYAHGIGGGVTFPSLGFAVNNYLFFTVQSSHAMELSTALDNHIHYCTPTDGTGKKFKFQLDVIAAATDGQYAVPTGSPYSGEITMASDYSTYHKLADLFDIAAVNTTVSTVYKCKLTRIAATADEYAGEIYIDFMDCHYQADTDGSRSETAK